jgi:hypothetical protein
MTNIFRQREYMYAIYILYMHEIIWNNKQHLYTYELRLHFNSSLPLCKICTLFHYPKSKCNQRGCNK